MTRNILILGASYGSLFGTKLLMAGHNVSLVCTRATADLIQREGTRVRFPVKGLGLPLELCSKTLSGKLTAHIPEEVDPRGYDLIVLGMQEAHYASRGVRELMARIARARRPCLAIMNMPPLPFLKRIPALATWPLRACYAEPEVWEGFDPTLVTLASPDPQAFRPADCAKNVLSVGLATNFKAARFEGEAPTAMLREIESGIDAVRLDPDGEAIEIPVKLKVHDSIFVPLAKWPMLIAGNYRCIRPSGMITIRDAVHGNLDESRNIYEWVSRLCFELGARTEDLVPFDKYAKAAETLVKPSSAARALFGGAQHIERVDSLVHRIARQRGLHCDALREIVDLVDERLGRTRSAAVRPFLAPAAAVPA